MLDTVDHREGDGGLAVIKDAGSQALAKLSDDNSELIRAAELSHYPPQLLSADRVKNLGQIHKGGVVRGHGAALCTFPGAKYM